MDLSVATGSATDSFGFTAEQIGKVVVAGKPAALTPGKDSLPVSATSDVNVVEL